jgi:hypothetical protein
LGRTAKPAPFVADYGGMPDDESKAIQKECHLVDLFRDIELHRRASIPQ